MNPALLTVIPGVVDAALKVYAKVAELKRQNDAGTPVTPEQVAALFAEYPVKTYDDYLNEARERQG